MPVSRNALHSTLRFIARHVEGFYPPIVAFVSVGFAFAVVATILFGAVAHAVHEGVTLPFDNAVLQWLYQHRSSTLDTVMLEVTSLGSAAVVIVMVFTVSAVLWQTGHRGSVGILLVGAAGGVALNALLKAWFDRPRPMIVEWATQVHTTSFPSGHAMESFIAYGAIAFVSARLCPGRIRVAIWTGAALVILSIGFSRMYLGVHYPSDVVAGYFAGFGWLTFLSGCTTAYRYFARRRMAAPPL